MKFKRLMKKLSRSFRLKPKLSFLVLVFLIFFAVWTYLIFNPDLITGFLNNIFDTQNSCFKTSIVNSELTQRISLGDKPIFGEESLITKNTIPKTKQAIQASINKKKEGTQAFAQGKCDQAKELFQAARNKFINDPENVIYLNNAQTGKNPLKIAVSIPISTKIDIAQEILRGVAYAQNEINQTGINRQKLLVEIIDDGNESQVVKKVADELVKDPLVLAVIGHNSSKASLDAFYFYQDKLVMVSPTSTSDSLSAINRFIFRTVFPNLEMTEILAKYTVKTAQKKKIAICYPHDDPNSSSVTKNFQRFVNHEGGEIVNLYCNLSDSNFNAAMAIKQANNITANALFISPNINNLKPVIDLANANQGKLALFGDPTLYTNEILQGQVEGLVLVAPWHPSVNPSFAQKMKNFWGGQINWRTATAYDATRAIIVGLQQDQTRTGLQQVLRSPEFTASGENGDIRFDPNTGDPVGTPVLIRIFNKQFEKIPTTS